MNGVNTESFGFVTPVDSLNFVTPTTKVNGVGVWKKVNLGTIKSWISGGLIDNTVYPVTYNVAATGNTAMAGKIVKMTVSGVVSYCVVDKLGNRIDFAKDIDLSAYLTTSAAASTYANKTALGDSAAAVRSYANQRATNAETTAIATSKDYTDSVIPDVSGLATKSSVDTAKANIRAESTNNINYILSKSDTLKQAISLEGTQRMIAVGGTWSKQGNANLATDFFGTINNVDLLFKRNNFQVMKFVAGGVIVGNGNASPTGSNSMLIGCNYASITGSNVLGIGVQYANASASNSILIGNNSSSGNYSICIGNGNVSGTYSLSVGSVVSGSQSVGVGSTVKSNNSISVGDNLINSNFASAVFGSHNDTLTQNNLTSHIPTARIFQLGNGTAGSFINGVSIPTIYSNAVTVLRNGNFSIGSNYAPTEKLEVSGRIKSEKLQLTQNITPTSTTDPQGNLGDICKDESYIYVKCVQGWKRAALSTF